MGNMVEQKSFEIKLLKIRDYFPVILFTAYNNSFFRAAYKKSFGQRVVMLCGLEK
jgi:hypothetical protein